MTLISAGIPFVTSDWFQREVRMPVLADYASGVEHEAAAGHGEAAGHEAAGHGAASGHEGGHGVLAVTHEHEHAAHVPAMAGSIVVAALGILVSFLTYGRGIISAEAWARRLRPLYVLFKNKWFFDEIYQVLVVRTTLLLAGLCRLFDIYVVDALVNGAGKFTVRLAWFVGGVDLLGVDGLVNGLGQTIIGLGRAARKLQTGRIQHYVYGFMAILLVIVFGKMLR
jgi:NADH:ubiquinone oxidoreductase subunit 5 (subunit L)/multisubunit Na+/H+ antiporter MnhA subunit